MHLQASHRELHAKLTNQLKSCYGEPPVHTLASLSVRETRAVKHTHRLWITDQCVHVDISMILLLPLFSIAQLFSMSQLLILCSIHAGQLAIWNKPEIEVIVL